MKEENKKSIEFTKEQFLALMKNVYLGNWMANAKIGAKDQKIHNRQLIFLLNKISIPMSQAKMKKVES